MNKVTISHKGNPHNPIFLLLSKNQVKNRLQRIALDLFIQCFPNLRVIFSSR